MTGGVVADAPEENYRKTVTVDGIESTLDIVDTAGQVWGGRLAIGTVRSAAHARFAVAARWRP